jgi:hypothetical protein
MASYMFSRHPKITRVAITAAVLAALGTASYVLLTSRLPDSICVTAKSAAPAPARAVSKPAAPQEAPSVPDVNLAGLDWSAYRGYELPVSLQAGPRETAGGLATGYADSPLGALLAAVNIAARTSWQFGPQVFQPTISAQVTGQFAGQMLSSDQLAYTQQAQAQGTQVPARQVAYSYEGYTPSDATVDIVTGATDSDGAPVYVVTQIQAEWLDGDWKIIAPPGGDWANSATQVTSTAGYTTFPGQGG